MHLNVNAADATCSTEIEMANKSATFGSPNQVMRSLMTRCTVEDWWRRNDLFWSLAKYARRRGSTTLEALGVYPADVEGEGNASKARHDDMTQKIFASDREGHRVSRVTQRTRIKEPESFEAGSVRSAKGSNGQQHDLRS